MDSLSAEELRSCVKQTASLERNWNSSKPRAVRPPEVINLGFAFLDCLYDFAVFTSRYFVLPMKDGELIAWDTEKNACIGRHRLDATLTADICYSSWVRYVDGSLSVHYVVGKYAFAEYVIFDRILDDI